MTVAEAGTAAVIPLAYDIVWLLVVLVWLLIPIAIAVTERRRERRGPKRFCGSWWRSCCQSWG